MNEEQISAQHLFERQFVELVKIWRGSDTASNSLDMPTILVLAPKNIRSKRVRIWNPLSLPTPPKALHHRQIWSEYSVSGSAAVSCAPHPSAGSTSEQRCWQEIAGERKTTWRLKSTLFGERPRLAPADSCPPLRSVTGLPQTTCQDRKTFQLRTGNFWGHRAICTQRPNAMASEWPSWGPVKWPPVEICTVGWRLHQVHVQSRTSKQFVTPLPDRHYCSTWLATNTQTWMSGMFRQKEIKGVGDLVCDFLALSLSLALSVVRRYLHSLRLPTCTCTDISTMCHLAQLGLEPTMHWDYKSEYLHSVVFWCDSGALLH